MISLRRIFILGRLVKECPRCLGKGYVDWDDIKRLNQELIWIPGHCAYCNGMGKVNSKTEKNVPVAMTYLNNSISENERKRIINRHPDALKRSKEYNDKIEKFINEISYLHFQIGLTPLQITRFYLMNEEKSDTYESKKEKLFDYVEQLIQNRQIKD